MGVTGDPLFIGCEGSLDLLFEFWDPSLCRERLKLETSNLARRLPARGANEKNAKLGQRGSW